jgi:hypothetical protein
MSNRLAERPRDDTVGIDILGIGEALVEFSCYGYIIN